MTKQDTVGAVLRKLDHEWSKKGNTFCKVVKEFLKIEGGFECISDDDVLVNIKDIEPDKKHEK